MEFGERHPLAKPSLDHWFRLARAASWASTHEIASTFSKAKVLTGERVRFEIHGGAYRLVVSFDFERQIAFVKFVGTHAEYDRIDALSVTRF